MGARGLDGRCVAVTAIRRLIAGGLSVEDACAEMKFPVSTYYFWRKRTENGSVPFEAKPCGRPARYAGASVAKLEDAVRKLALKRSEWGCHKYATYLPTMGFSLSAPSVHRVLVRLGLETRKQRDAYKEPETIHAKPRHRAVAQRRRRRGQLKLPLVPVGASSWRPQA